MAEPDRNPRHVERDRQPKRQGEDRHPEQVVPEEDQDEAQRAQDA